MAAPGGKQIGRGMRGHCEYVSALGSNLGALDGGSKCCMSILRNGIVACLCRLFFRMSHVAFKKRLCRISL